MDSNILSSTENILMSCTVADRHVCMQPLTFPELEELDSSATSWTDTDIHVDVL